MHGQPHTHGVIRNKYIAKFPVGTTILIFHRVSHGLCLLNRNRRRNSIRFAAAAPQLMEFALENSISFGASFSSISLVVNFLYPGLRVPSKFPSIAHTFTLPPGCVSIWCFCIGLRRFAGKENDNLCTVHVLKAFRAALPVSPEVATELPLFPPCRLFQGILSKDGAKSGAPYP